MSIQTNPCQTAGRWLRIPMRGYEMDLDAAWAKVATVTNPHEGL